MSRKTPLILCTAAVAYLAGDFFAFNGPLNRTIHGAFSPDAPSSVEKARKEGVIARVHEYPITTSQLDRATAESLWTVGKKPADLPADAHLAARKAALRDLIEHELLRASIAAAEQKIEVRAAEVDARCQEVFGAFDKAGLDAALKAQGVPSEKDLRDRITAHLRMEKYIRSQVQVSVSEEEAKKWFAEKGPSIGLPERLEARHIFAATLSTPPEDAKKKLEGALAALNAKQKDFAALAKELSEDPATKDSGGNLGWMSRQRLSPDFAEPVFSLAVNQPSLIRTRLGWHLIEVTGRKAAEPRSFEDAQPEVIAALEAVKAREAVRSYREKLRSESAAAVRIYDETLR
jgi:parvulin-like peptidyl-prolyl isomerase